MRKVLAAEGEHLTEAAAGQARVAAAVEAGTGGRGRLPKQHKHQQQQDMDGGGGVGLFVGKGVSVLGYGRQVQRRQLHQEPIAPVPRLAAAAKAWHLVDPHIRAKDMWELSSGKGEVCQDWFLGYRA
jgi:hypothetical protein